MGIRSNYLGLVSSTLLKPIFRSIDNDNFPGPWQHFISMGAPDPYINIFYQNYLRLVAIQW